MATLYFLKNATHTQMLGMILKDDDTVLVIDGGTTGDTDQMVSFLHSLCGETMHVNAWFLTHPHSDHLSVLLEILKHHPEVRIDAIYHHFPGSDAMRNHSKRGEGELLPSITFEALTDERFHKVEEDDFFTFGTLSVKVMRTYEPSIHSDFTNNSSAVYKFCTPTKSLLVLGDLGVEGGYDLMKKRRAEELAADYTQIAHHGQNGANRDFYEYLRPVRCLWPSPSWLWNNDTGGGFDTGIYNTVRTREWISAIGCAKAHFVEKDGPIEIEL